MLDIKIGCDPELFAYDTKAEKYISVHDILEGTKQEPVPVPRGAVQVDGVAAEFNIFPAATRNEFFLNVRTVLTTLEEIVKKKNPFLELRASPVADFDKEYFDSLPHGTKLLGCEADFDAYTGRANPRPDADTLFRTGSGHIHIGWTENAEYYEDEHFNTCCELTKKLDFTLYKSSLFWDTDERRRSLYGKPGAFRPKPYGLEYRVLSNKWLSNEKTTKFVYDLAKSTTMLFLKGLPINDNYVERGEEGYNAFLASHNLPEYKHYEV